MTGELLAPQDRHGSFSTSDGLRYSLRLNREGVKSGHEPYPQNVLALSLAASQTGNPMSPECEPLQQFGLRLRRLLDDALYESYPADHFKSIEFSILDGHEATEVGVAIQKEAEVGSHHFLPALKSLVHPSARIGIVLVVRGIIVTKLEVQAAALRQLQRYSVRNLPVEIVARDIQHNSFAPIPDKSPCTECSSLAGVHGDAGGPARHP